MKKDVLFDKLDNIAKLLAINIANGNYKMIDKISILLSVGLSDKEIPMILKISPNLFRVMKCKIRKEDKENDENL